MVAGASLALATFSFANVFTDAEGNRFHTLATTGSSLAVELTFLASDSVNASLYQGDLIVPQTVRHGMPSKTYQVTALSQYACIYCDSLTSIVIPEGVTSIGYAALSECPRLQMLQLPNTLSTLSDWACYADSALQQVTLPDATSRVGACSFAFCTRLDSVALGNATRSVAAQAFYYCQSLTEVRLPWTVSQIGEYAFAYCENLQRITVEGRPVAITPDVFEGVDVSNCTLIVPSDMVDAYAEADVWCDFNIVDGGYLNLESPEDDLSEPLFRYHLEGHTLCVEVLGDAPALLYNLRGERLFVAGSHSGMSRVSLTAGTYILRCGKESYKMAL